MSQTTIRIATRRSPLAMAQSQLIADRIAAVSGLRTELVPVVSHGDVNQGPLAQMGGTGVFVTAVRDAVLDGRADVAVHSLKDLPTASGPFELFCVPEREDPRDALCTAGARLEELPPGARIGTGSPRRVAQLRALRPDLEIVGIRGNVGTRLDRVRNGDVHGVILAMSGLRRLGLGDAATQPLEPGQMMPAPGQGALAVEASTASLDSSTGAVLAQTLREMEDPSARASVTAERSFLAALEAGCSAPVGAYGQIREEGFWEPEVQLDAVVETPDGSLLRVSATGSAGGAEELGHGLAAKALATAGYLGGSTR